MSYQAFPPPLSTSPPPLDELPSFPDEEEEEQLARTGQGSPAFDITGLSGKLPPTPVDSPAKRLPEYPPRELLTNASQFYSNNFLDNDAIQKGNIEPEMEQNITSTVNRFTNNDFKDISQSHVAATSSHFEIGDFGIGSKPDNEILPKVENVSVNFKDSCESTQNVFARASVLASSSDLQNREHVEVKDACQRKNISDCYVKADEKDIEYVHGKPRSKISHNNDNQLNDIKNVNEMFSDKIGSNDRTIITENLRECDVHDNLDLYCEGSADVISDAESDFGDFTSFDIDKTIANIDDQSADIGDFGDFASFDVESSVPNIDDTPADIGIVNETATEQFKNISDIGTNVNDVVLCEAAGSFDKFDAFANFECSTTEKSFVPSFPVMFEPVLGSDLPSPEHSAPESFSPDPAIVADDVVMSCSLPTIEGVADVSPGEDDFGYQDIALEEDDLDSAGNAGVKGQAEMVEATNRLVMMQEIEEYQCSDRPMYSDGGDEDGDDFQNFLDNEEYTNDNHVAEFDEFASAKIDDAFGEFTSGAGVCETADPDKDEFGEFSDGLSEPMPSPKCFVTGLMRGTSVESGELGGGAEEQDPLLHRLESLVRKWVAPLSGHPQPSVATTPLLRDVVSGDAFVWRKLECVEWRSVVWQSSVAQQLLLEALNVDARNILYNQKWSSSIPLFAQSLTFSPLTPAKPSSSSSNNNNNISASSSSVVPSSAKVTSSPSSPHTARDWGEEAAAESGADSDKEPTREATSALPAQFDWLASRSVDPLHDAADHHESSTVAGTKSSYGTHPTLPHAVQQLLTQSIAVHAPDTVLAQLTQQEQEFINTLPNLSFMTAKVLMFPIVGETE